MFKSTKVPTFVQDIRKYHTTGRYFIYRNLSCPSFYQHITAMYMYQLEMY